MAVVSRLPFEDKDHVEAPTGWFPGWRVVLDTEHGPVQVLQVQLRPPVSERGSHRWNTSVGKLSSRLDHIYCDGRLEPVHAEVLDMGRSDHLPIVAAFRVKPERL